MHKAGTAAFVAGTIIYALLFGIGLFISETILNGLTNRVRRMVVSVRRPR